MKVVQAIAAGVKALPATGRAFAATQAAWRFFANPRVTLAKLVEPLRAAGHQACDDSPAPYVLLVYDWSKLNYDGHKSTTAPQRELLNPRPNTARGDSCA